MYDEITGEYNRFMSWFKENYPNEHDKYYDNIGVPLKLGGGVVVNSNNKISKEEQDALYEIASSYYSK